MYIVHIKQEHRNASLNTTHKEETILDWQAVVQVETDACEQSHETLGYNTLRSSIEYQGVSLSTDKTYFFKSV